MDEALPGIPAVLCTQVNGSDICSCYNDFMILVHSDTLASYPCTLISSCSSVINGERIECIFTNDEPLTTALEILMTVESDIDLALNTAGIQVSLNSINISGRIRLVMAQLGVGAFAKTALFTVF